MRLFVCSVYDRQLEAYMTPFFAQSKGMAIRSFSDEVNRAAEDNVLYKHPGDFELHCLAVFESDGGTFDEEGKGMLITAASCSVRETASVETRSRVS